MCTQTDKMIQDVRKWSTMIEESIFVGMEIEKDIEKSTTSTQSIETTLEINVRKEQEGLQEKEINTFQFSYPGRAPIQYKLRQITATLEVEVGSSISRIHSKDHLELITRNTENEPKRKKEMLKGKVSRQDEMYADIFSTKKINFHRAAKIKALEIRKKNIPYWTKFLRECREWEPSRHEEERTVNVKTKQIK